MILFFQNEEAPASQKTLNFAKYMMRWEDLMMKKRIIQ